MRSLIIGKLLSLRGLLVPFVAALVWTCAPACAQDRSADRDANRNQDRPARVLYFTHSAGYRHDVIPASRQVLKELGEAAPRFEVTASEDVADFTAENLRRYGAVMFFTTGELPMTDAQKRALTDFVRAGGGFIGVHSATDTFYQWAEYGKLIGGYFDQHPWHQGVQIAVADPSDPLVKFLGSSIALTDEIYQIRDFDVGGSHVLLRLDPASVDLTRPDVHRHPYGWPLAWTRRYGDGRVFYTALGHEEAVWRDAGYQAMLRNAVLWALGRAP
jgi:type 1 glutamine amidotransferase